MGTDSARQLDEKGRITLPKSLREQLGLDPGDEVTVSLEAGGIVVRPQPTVSREEFVESMRGYVNADTRRADAPVIDPLELDADWTGDLPE